MLHLLLELPRKAFTVTVDLRVATNSVFCLFGPSATGKSSILSVIAGFETNCRRAYLTIDDEILTDTDTRTFIPPWRRGIGYMEQSARLFPNMTVEQNILYGAPRGKGGDWYERIVDELELRDYLGTRPQHLSGGLTQRVALARAIVPKPRVLLLDEPFSALDWMSRRDLQDLVKSVHHEFPTTIIFVTHQLTEAQRLADQIALIDEGRILQTDTPNQLMENPVSWRCAQLMGYTTALRGSDGHRYAVHPDRVILGHHPNMGLPLKAVVRDAAWYEGRRRVRLALVDGGNAVEPFDITISAVDEVNIGEEIAITLHHPPVVG